MSEQDDDYVGEKLVAYLRFQIERIQDDLSDIRRQLDQDRLCTEQAADVGLARRSREMPGADQPAPVSYGQTEDRVATRGERKAFQVTIKPTGMSLDRLNQLVGIMFNKKDWNHMSSRELILLRKAIEKGGLR